MKYPILMLAAVALIAAAPADPPAPTPPPTPPPLTQPQASPAAVTPASPDAMPAATPTPNLDTILGGKAAPAKGKHPSAKGSPTPAPDLRKGLDGVWEVQIQRGPKTEYDHMNLVQNGQNIAGVYLTTDKKKYPVTGSLDGQSNVRLVISLADGTTILLEARLDGTTDMLGMFTDARERVPFTAAYRPKEKWIDNVNATPGGLGGGSGPP